MSNKLQNNDGEDNEDKHKDCHSFCLDQKTRETTTTM